MITGFCPDTFSMRLSLLHEHRLAASSRVSRLLSRCVWIVVEVGVAFVE